MTPIPSGRPHTFLVKRGTFTSGFVEWWPSHPREYHYSVWAPCGPSYIGIAATLADAKRAIRDNT